MGFMDKLQFWKKNDSLGSQNPFKGLDMGGSPDFNQPGPQTQPGQPFQPSPTAAPLGGQPADDLLGPQDTMGSLPSNNLPGTQPPPGFGSLAPNANASPQQPGFDRDMGFEQPSSFSAAKNFQESQQAQMQQPAPVDSSDMTLLSQKLDTINAKLETINQRLIKIERLAESEPHHEQKTW